MKILFATLLFSISLFAQNDHKIDGLRTLMKAKKTEFAQKNITEYAAYAKFVWRRYGVTTTHVQDGSYEGFRRCFYTYLFWKEGNAYFIEKFNEDGSLGKVSFDGTEIFAYIAANAETMQSETPEDYAYSDHGSVYFVVDDVLISHMIFIRTENAETEKLVDPAGMDNVDGKNVNYSHNKSLKIFGLYHDMKSIIGTYASAFPCEKF